ncbi:MULTISPECIES: hypothetical protein [unclassified Pseudomonas]|uniref:hypothetical protein n=1 Tax=unclassified Pseudomonas TaxID=196821 RepID=UPI0024475ECC|nr:MULTISPECIES: hypothetical protein [unclassified Pseudomonas]MDH0303615.1 hypothetical protein [Pseudomonas sp. GD04091]MDH1987064.1 hypothetical protein [Pseudomonas sp. GD03689]
MSKIHRFTLLPLAALGLATLMACGSASKAPPTVDAATMAAFVAAMQSSLINRIAPANQGHLVGVVTLKITLNRQNQPIACEARRSAPRHARLLPRGLVASDFRQMAQLVERQCWLTVYPPVPEGLFEEDRVEVMAPLVLLPYPESPAPDRL